MNLARTTRAAVAALCVWTLVVVALPATALPQGDLQMSLEIALGKMQQGQSEDALRDLEKILTQNDSFWPAYFHRGRLLGSMGDAQGRATPSSRQSSSTRGSRTSISWPRSRLSSSATSTRAWEQIILASNASMPEEQVQQGLAMLRQASEGPPGLAERLSAARVYVDAPDESKLRGRSQNPFAQGVGSRIDSADISQQQQSGSGAITSTTSSSQATGTGTRIMQQSAGEINNMLVLTRKALGESSAFGLVQNPELAQYRLVYEIDDIADVSDSLGAMKMKGYVKLYNAQSGDEAFSRVIEFKDLANSGDVSADLGRLMGNLEEWLAEAR